MPEEEAKTEDLSMISEPIRSLVVPISSLRPDPRNARKHGKENLAAIADSLRRFGQQKPIVVDADGIILAGNGTVEAAKSLGWTNISAVRTSLSGPEAIGFAIADNRTAELAEWDRVELASLLKELPSEVVPFTGFSREAFEDLVAGVDPSVDGKYTVKISPPIYVPRGDRPRVEELVDRSKTRKILAEIEAANLPEDVAAFLRVAAERHSVFDYAKIAEFYAHADPATKNLFERSALVIIDVGAAIENGFVEMVEKIRSLAEQEGEDDAK